MKRRDFVKGSLSSALCAGAGVSCGSNSSTPLVSSVPSPMENQRNARVAIVRCVSYGAELLPAFRTCFDLLGGLGQMVKGKTVTIKINLAGKPYHDLYGRTAGETYLTHGNTVCALVAALFESGTKRVQIVESANYREELEAVLEYAGFAVNDLLSLGNVHLFNTRNVGKAWNYVSHAVANGGYLFFWRLN